MWRIALIFIFKFFNVPAFRPPTHGDPMEERLQVEGRHRSTACMRHANPHFNIIQNIDWVTTVNPCRGTWAGPIRPAPDPGPRRNVNQTTRSRSMMANFVWRVPLFCSDKVVLFCLENYYIEWNWCWIQSFFLLWRLEIWIYVSPFSNTLIEIWIRERILIELFIIQKSMYFKYMKNYIIYVAFSFHFIYDFSAHVKLQYSRL